MENFGLDWVHTGRGSASQRAGGVMVYAYNRQVPHLSGRPTCSQSQQLIDLLAHLGGHASMYAAASASIGMHGVCVSWGRSCAPTMT